MDGISFINGKGSDVFIPYQAIDCVTIEPNTEYRVVPSAWYTFARSDWVKTGKWDLLIETSGKNGGRIVFGTKEAAEQKLEEIKKASPIELVINKITVKQG